MAGLIEPPTTGQFCKARCPKCGCGMLINAAGEAWCSFVRCDYGLITKVRLVDTGEQFSDQTKPQGGVGEGARQ